MSPVCRRLPFIFFFVYFFSSSLQMCIVGGLKRLGFTCDLASLWSFIFRLFFVFMNSLSIWRGVTFYLLLLCAWLHFWFYVFSSRLASLFLPILHSLCARGFYIILNDTSNLSHFRIHFCQNRHEYTNQNDDRNINHFVIMNFIYIYFCNFAFIVFVGCVHADLITHQCNWACTRQFCHQFIHYYFLFCYMRSKLNINIFN